MYIIPQSAHRHFTCFLVAAFALLVMSGGASAQSTTAGAPPAATSLPATIPIFPLPDVMLFPEMSVPLHIFEPRYRAMVADALKGNRIIGMVLLRPGYEADYERSPSIFPIGCAGVITDVETLPDGEYNIVLQAFAKFTVTREEASRPYRIAHVTAIPEVLGDADRTAVRVERGRLTALIAAAGGRLGFGRIPEGISDEQFVNGVAQFARVDPLEREQLLERDGVLPRATALVDLLSAIVAAPRGDDRPFVR